MESEAVDHCAHCELDQYDNEHPGDDLGQGRLSWLEQVYVHGKHCEGNYSCKDHCGIAGMEGGVEHVSLVDGHGDQSVDVKLGYLRLV